MSDSDKLAEINSATLGTMPVVTLPDGSKVQAGTVGSLIVNIRTYDSVVEKSENKQELLELEEKFKLALPLLTKAGMFDLFPAEDWIRGSKSAGRTKVGELFLERQKENQVDMKKKRAENDR